MKIHSSFWLRSIFYTLLQRFSIMFFNVIAFMIIVRGVADFAVFALYTAIYITFEMIKQGLLRNPTIKFLSLRELADQRNEVQTASLVLNVIISLVVIAGLAFFSAPISEFLKTPSLAILLQWSILYILVMIPFSHCEVILQAQFQFQRIFRAYFIRQFLFLAGVLALFFADQSYFTVLNLVKLQIASLAIAGIVMWVEARQYLASRLHFNAPIITRMLQFGKYILGTGMFSTLARMLDRFITANVITNAALRNTYVSYYETVGRVYTLIDIPSLAAADVLFPKNVETIENDGLYRVKYYFERMIGTILSVIIPISLVIFAFPQFILVVLAGKAYIGAAPILQMTILFAIVRPLSYQFGSTLDAIGKPQINFWVNFFLLVFALAANYVCLSRFGGIGAAYASIIFYIVSFCVMIATLKHYIHVELRKIFTYTLQSYVNMYQGAMNFVRKGQIGTRQDTIAHESEASHTART